MNIKFEDPVQFLAYKELNNIRVTYSNLVEICQGGPEVGDLSINGKIIDGFRFGGPCILDGEFIYIPVYIRRFFFGTGFKLAKIHASTLQMHFLSKMKDLIHLYKIQDGKIYFFEGINTTNMMKITK